MIRNIRISEVCFIDMIKNDYTAYKKCSTVLLMPKCDFRCEAEAKEKGICNSHIFCSLPIKYLNHHTLIKYYLKLNSEALVFSGLEPMNNVVDEFNSSGITSYNSMLEIISILRKEYKCKHDIVIYTGYEFEELFETNHKHGSILPIIKLASLYDGDIIVKYGRYKQYDENKRNDSYFNEILGVNLSTSNQYAVRYSKIYNESELYFYGKDITKKQFRTKVLNAFCINKVKDIDTEIKYNICKQLEILK